MLILPLGKSGIFGTLFFSIFFSGLTIGLIVSCGPILFVLAFWGPFITRKIKLRKAQKAKDISIAQKKNQNHGLLL
jgi:hypothetical protein